MNGSHPIVSRNKYHIRLNGMLERASRLYISKEKGMKLFGGTR